MGVLRGWASKLQSVNLPKGHEKGVDTLKMCVCVCVCACVWVGEDYSGCGCCIMLKALRTSRITHHTLHLFSHHLFTPLLAGPCLLTPQYSLRGEAELLARVV